MRKVICVDLDGTILTSVSQPFSADKFGKPVKGAKKFLSVLINDGWWVIIYSVRGDKNKVAKTLLLSGIERGKHYSAINRRKNPLKGSNKGKCGADIYVCDRSITFLGNWKNTYKKIKNFKTWEHR
jgi:predicted secreted acid phosphatase